MTAQRGDKLSREDPVSLVRHAGDVVADQHEREEQLADETRPEAEAQILVIDEVDEALRHLGRNDATGPKPEMLLQERHKYLGPVTRPHVEALRRARLKHPARTGELLLD